MRHGLHVLDDVFERVSPEPNTGCWLWLGGTSGKSKSRPYNLVYGMARFGGKKILAHRLSFLLATGALPLGLQVCHRCDQPLCVNPDHLFLGTQMENMQDALAKGRVKMSRKRFCKNGHDKDAVGRRPTYGGRSNRCARCHAEYYRKKHNRTNGGVHAPG